jgi:hypothetical protein
MASLLGSLGITPKTGDVHDVPLENLNSDRSSDSGEEELQYDDVGSEEEDEIEEELEELEEDSEDDEAEVNKKENPYILPHIGLGIVDQDEDHRNWVYDKDVYVNGELPKKFTNGWDMSLIRPEKKELPPTEEEIRLALLEASRQKALAKVKREVNKMTSVVMGIDTDKGWVFKKPPEDFPKTRNFNML